MRLRLLGPPQLERPGAPPLPLPWQRTTALLAYVACHEGGVARSRVALFLRPDADAETGFAYLRRLLHRLKASAPEAAAALEAEPQRLRWRGGCDVHELHSAHAAQRWDEVLALHGGGLLAGQGALGDEAVDGWVEDERLRLRQRQRVALLARLQQALLDRGRDGVAALLQRLLDDDPLDEDGVQFALTHAATEIEQRIALDGYDTLARRMSFELALKPLPATQALAAALRSRRFDAPAATPVADALPARRIATPPGRLIGRADMLAALAAQLARADVRLLALRGPGGVGKTRLALELAAAQAAAYADGVTWVDLAAVTSGHGLLDAIADALGLAAREAPAAAAIESHLHARTMLVVLDNVEQLVAHIARLAPMIDAAPRVRWLATSREALPLSVAHDVELPGLEHAGARSPAAELFREHAQRHGVDCGDADAPALERIGALLGGLPLAIELAAAWVPVMTPAQIADAIEADLALVAGDAAAALDRKAEHRSLQAVFEPSWQRLDAGERLALAGLTTLHSAFDLAAAQDIARCPAPTLLRLAGRSLVQREAGGRFRLHPLLRRLVMQAADPAALAGFRRRHAEHFLRRVAAPPRLFVGDWDDPRHAAWRPRIDDLAAAWATAVEERRFESIAEALPNLQALLTMGGRFDEMLAFAQSAADAPAPPALQPALAAMQTTALALLDRHDEAGRLADRWLGEPLGHEVRYQFATCKARVLSVRGEHEATARWLEAAHEAAVASGNPYAMMRTRQNLGAIAWALGRADEAVAHQLAMLALAEAHGAGGQRARAQRALAVTENSRGRPHEALPLLEASLGYFERVGDDYEAAMTLRSLSFVAGALGDGERRRALADAALATLERLGRAHDVAGSLLAVALAWSEIAGEDAAAAAKAVAAYARCLRQSLQQRLQPTALQCVFGLAALIAADRAEALAWLQFCAGHPALRAVDRPDLDAALARLQPSDGERARARADAAAYTLETLGARLLARAEGHVHDA